MEFGQEAARRQQQLFRELAGGFNLNAKLLALLGGHPLDRRRQEEARAMSQELSRVFMASLLMLNPPDDDSAADEARTAPSEVSTDGSVAPSNPTKNKLIRREVTVTPLRKGREEEVIMRTEITPSPHKDGYQWRKYGQKNIQNRHFSRYYFKCTHSRDGRCMAKKQVQQQDGSRPDAPVYQVTYVNEHTCHQAARDDSVTAAAAGRPLQAPGVVGLDYTTSTRNGGAFGLPHHRYVAGGIEESDAIVSCLATVISGAPPPPPPAEASPSGPWYAAAPAPAWCSAGLEGMDFAYGPPPPIYPGDEAELIGPRDGDASMDDVVARYEDTVWPQYAYT